MFNDVGYSDRVSGIDASIGSLEFKATHIEKHFTIDNSLPGRDNKFAILPKQLLELTGYIKIAENFFIKIMELIIKNAKQEQGLNTLVDFQVTR